MSALDLLERDFDLAMKIHEEEERNHKEISEQHVTDEEMARVMQQQFDKEEEVHLRKISGAPKMSNDTAATKANEDGGGGGGTLCPTPPPVDLLNLDDDDTVVVVQPRTSNAYDPYAIMQPADSNSNSNSNSDSNSNSSHLLNEGGGGNNSADMFSVISFTEEMRSNEKVAPLPLPLPLPPSSKSVPSVVETSTSSSTVSGFSEFDELGDSVPFVATTEIAPPVPVPVPVPVSAVSVPVPVPVQARRLSSGSKPRNMKPPSHLPSHQPTLVNSNDARGNLSALAEIDFMTGGGGGTTSDSPKNGRAFHVGDVSVSNTMSPTNMNMNNGNNANTNINSGGDSFTGFGDLDPFGSGKKNKLGGGEDDQNPFEGL